MCQSICLGCFAPCPQRLIFQSGQKAPVVLVPCKCHCGSRRRAKSAKGSQTHPSPYEPWSSTLPGCVRFPRYSPLFSPAAVLMDFYGRAVQHYRRLIHQILPDQGMERRFPHICPRLCAEATVHALPWAVALRQIARDPCVEPIQDCVKHLTVAFCGPSALGFSFWGKRSFILFH